jgi:hypothetical protein
MIKWVKENDHLLLFWFWVLMAIPVVTIWKDSILLVLIMSLYANCEASLSAHQAKKGNL